MSNNKPKILLSLNLSKDIYVNAVEKSGAIPVAEYCPTYSDEYDSLILCGGNDIDPAYYNEEFAGAINIDEARDKAEMELFKKFLEAGKPILGICRGCQLINVAFGGSLHQNLDNAIEHKDGVIHSAKAVEDSFVSKLYGTEFSINSFHHQAVKECGQGLEIIATAFDGKTVEAIQHKELPVYGVQWHPERICYEYKKENVSDGADVFKFFIDVTLNNMKK